MLFSLAVIFLCGMLLGGLCKKLKLPPLLGMAVLLLLLGMTVRGTCRRCLMILLFLLALAAFPHRDLTMFALGGLAVWCLMPGRDSGKKGPSGRS